MVGRSFDTITFLTGGFRLGFLLLVAAVSRLSGGIILPLMGCTVAAAQSPEWDNGAACENFT